MEDYSNNYINDYTNEYLASHDIDWFCIINDTPIHAASNEGDLPYNIKHNALKNRENQNYAFSREYKYNFNEIEINFNQLNRIIKTPEDYSPFEIIEMKNNYLRTFIDMARRGFYSYDRFEYKEFEDFKYVLVAYPKIFKPSYNHLICTGLQCVNTSMENVCFEDIDTFKALKFVDIKI